VELNERASTHDGALEVADFATDPDIAPIILFCQNGVAPSAKLEALIDHLVAAFCDPP
jgi:hypothetical protein